MITLSLGLVLYKPRKRCVEKAVVVVHAQLAAVTLDRRDNTKGSQVGEDVYQHVVNQSRHTLSRTRDNTQHDVTGLRDRREGQESFQVLLTDGKQVTDGNRQHNQGPQDALPDSRVEEEDLVENQQQSKGSRALRDNRQIRGYLRGSTFVNVGRPQVEGNQRKFESHTGQHEYNRGDEQRRAVGRDGYGNIAEVERTRNSVEEREAQQEESRRKDSRKEVFGTGLIRLAVFLGKGDECSHRQRSGLEPDKEEQEVTGRNHQVHTEEGYQQQFVELAPTHFHIGILAPRYRLQQHDEGTYIEHGLYHRGHGRSLIHAAKSRGRLDRYDVPDRMQGKQDTRCNR